MSDERLSFSDLKTTRAAMTQGEWRVNNRQGHIALRNAWHTIDGGDGTVVVNRFGGHWPESNATGIVATHNAADVLIGIAEAALALQTAGKEGDEVIAMMHVASSSDDYSAACWLRAWRRDDGQRWTASTQPSPR